LLSAVGLADGDDGCGEVVGISGIGGRGQILGCRPLSGSVRYRRVEAREGPLSVESCILQQIVKI
jgi:hypothetical protein